MALNSVQKAKFANEQIRPLADLLATAYRTSVAVQAYWFANNLGADFPIGDTTPLADGSATDGRRSITNNDVTNLINRAIELKNLYEATNNAALNTVLNVAVNIRA